MRNRNEQKQELKRLQAIQRWALTSESARHVRSMLELAAVARHTRPA